MNRKETKSTKSVPIRKHHRVGVFVDTQNMYHSAKNLYGAKVNFREVLKVAVSGRQLIRAIAYVIETESGEEKAFLGALKKATFEIKAKDLQIFAGGMKKGDWDVGIAVDAIRLSPNLDVVVIVSGDGDFKPLVEYLKFKGVVTQAVGFRRSTSSKLIEAVDEFIDLGDNKKRYLL